MSVPSTHLYVHIPFCHRVCPYCAFFKHTPANTDMRGFVAGIVKEAELRLPPGWTPETVYFGGGTPSMLSPVHLESLVTGLQQTVNFGRVREWSFEANPATFTPSKVRQWRRLGINRISLGVQSFEPRLLRLLGREHSPAQIEENVRLLRDEGMPQINLDLMFSLPGQTKEEWERTLEKALALSPDHISAYNLTYEEDTEFFDRYGSQNDEENDAAMYTMADQLLSSAGFRHYEISNYARGNSLSLHNQAYWRGEDYYGLGPGAVGTIQGVRYQNSGDTPAYINALARGELPPGTQEIITPINRRTELIGLGLRTDEGIPREWIPEEKRALIPMLLQEGLAEISAHGKIKLTLKGSLLTDAIAAELI